MQQFTSFSHRLVVKIGYLNLLLNGLVRHGQDFDGDVLEGRSEVFHLLPLISDDDENLRGLSDYLLLS